MKEEFDLKFQKVLKHSLHVPTFENIMETKNIVDALEYLKRRQSTIRCIRLIEMIEGVLAEQMAYHS